MTKSDPVSRDQTVADGVRFPHPPGVFRRFGLRHPRLTDVLLCLSSLFWSIAFADTAIGVFPALSGQPLTLAFTFGVVLLANAALMWRRRAPVLVASSLLTLSILLPNWMPLLIPVLMVACYSVGVYRSSRASWLVFGSSSIAAIPIAISQGLFWSVDGAALSQRVSGMVVATLIATLIGVNIGNRRRYVEALIELSRQLAVERDQQAHLAAAEERARIARELHDVVSHSLTVMVALAEGATATTDQDRARLVTETIANTGRDALTEMRAMLGVLRASDSDAPLHPVDAREALTEVIQSARSTGSTVNARLEVDLATLPSGTQRAIVRIVQEGLTNAVRHSQPTLIEVLIGEDAGSVVVSVLNDGVQRSTGLAGYGLQGVRERVAQLGGTLEAGRRGGPHGNGWLLRAKLPIVFGMKGV